MSTDSVVLFRWHEPCRSVAVSGDWCAWSKTGVPLSGDKDGRAFSGTVLLSPGKHRFRFVVDGKWRHNTHLLSEMDEGSEEPYNVIEVSADSGLSPQLPEKAPTENDAGVETTDYMNSLKEYGLRTPTTTAPKSLISVSEPYGGGGGSDTAVASAAAASARAASASASGGADGAGGATRSSNNGTRLANADAAADAAQKGSLFDAQNAGAAAAAASQELAEDASGDEAAEAAARSRLMARRRKEAEASSLAAVGACLVKSSVRKDGKLIVAMVGLPGRGKSFVARSILRHLDWIGLKSRIFSVKDRRREEVAVYEPAEYFEQGGEGEKIRNRLAAEVLDEALKALESDIDIAVYDSSNINQERRSVLQEAVAKSGLHAKVIFIENICNDEALVRQNILTIHQSSPEFREMSETEVERDFMNRIELYERIYQPLDAMEGHSFIKLIDAGSQMMTNLVSGYIPGRITLLCLNLHLKPRPIWMSRHGESEFNMQGRIGGDAPLTAAGKVYAGKLAEFMNRRYPTHAKPGISAPDTAGAAADGGGTAAAALVDGDEELVVWTSTMLRTGQTVAPMALHREVMKWSQLTEINAGLMDSLTYEYVAENMPDEYAARQNDKLRYRYPGGESYQDLFLRLEPVIFEMLRERSPLLVVGHQAILRVLYGYLTGKAPAECPTIHMPLHTAIKLTPRAYTCEEEWFRPLEECGVPDVKATAHHKA